MQSAGKLVLIKSSREKQSGPATIWVRTFGHARCGHARCGCGRPRPYTSTHTSENSSRPTEPCGRPRMNPC